MERRQDTATATLLVPASDPGGSSRLAAECLSRVARELQARGVRVGARLVRASDLRNPRVLVALRSRGIDALPALLAGTRAYVGLREVRLFCERALAAPPARGRRDSPESEASGDPEAADAAEEALESFYRGEMGGTSSRAGRFGLDAEDGDGESL